MSDLQERNTAAMIAAADRFDANVAELRSSVASLNAKVSSLIIEVDQLKEQAVMAAVLGRLEVTGNGGTV